MSTFLILDRSGEAEMRVFGELDFASVARLDGALDRLLADGCRALTVELTGVTFMDAAGLGALVRLQNRMRLCGGVATFLVGESQPRRLLRLTGMDQALRFVPTQSRRTAQAGAESS